MVLTKRPRDTTTYFAAFGFRDYHGYPGHYATYLMRRIQAEMTQVLLLSFWSSQEAIVAYAGGGAARKAPR